MNIYDKATRAKRLREDEDLKFFINEIREGAMADFASSGREETAKRERAHETLRVLKLFEAHLDATVSAQALEDKKERDRG